MDFTTSLLKRYLGKETFVTLNVFTVIFLLLLNVMLCGSQEQSILLGLKVKLFQHFFDTRLHNVRHGAKCLRDKGSTVPPPPPLPAAPSSGSNRHVHALRVGAGRGGGDLRGEADQMLWKYRQKSEYPFKVLKNFQKYHFRGKFFLFSNSFYLNQYSL